MKTVIYCRVPRHEKADSFETQRKMVREQANRVEHIKTVMWFKDGASRELTDAEIGSIFKAALRGEKSVTLERPLVKHEFEGPLGRRTVYGLRRYERPLFGAKTD